MGIIWTLWELPKTLERKIGLLEVIVGVSLINFCLLFLVVLTVQKRAYSQTGIFTISSLVVGFIIVLDGRRRLRSATDYEDENQLDALNPLREKWENIVDFFKDDTLNNLCKHLRVELGIDAEIVKHKSPEDIGLLPILYISRTVACNDLGCIKLRDKNIDIIQITYYNGGYEWYTFDYTIKANREVIEENEKILKAKTRVLGMEGGTFAGKVLDFEWIRDQLAKTLNADKQIKQAIIEENVIKSYPISVEIDKRKNNKISNVRIRHKNDYPEYPSKRLFQCYDNIALHIQEVFT